MERLRIWWLRTWPDLGWSHLAMALILAMFAGVGLYRVWNEVPLDLRSDFGRGPGWSCRDPGHGDPICHRDVRPER